MSSIISLSSPLGKFNFAALTTSPANFVCSILGIKTTCFVVGEGFFSFAKGQISPEGILIASTTGLDLTKSADIGIAVKDKTLLSKSKNIFWGGKVISGHSSINEPIKSVLIFLNNAELIISKYSQLEFKDIATIPLNSIEDITIEDATTIEKRLTVTRLLTIGIFAFAAKKKEINELYYVAVKWKTGNFQYETIFEFEGNNCIQFANIFKNNTVNWINQHIQ